MIPTEGQPFPQLGVPEMDQTHEAFVRHIALVETAADAEVLARLEELMRHTEAHFSQELQWMQAMQFPQIGCHSVEHDGVLAVMQEARRYVQEGKWEVGRVLARELGTWFNTHAQTMDAMLAYALLHQDEPQHGCEGGSCAVHRPEN